MKKTTILLALLFCFSMASFAQTGADGCLGTWLTGSKKGHVLVYKQGDRYFGKIVWLKEPNDINGKPKVDSKNTDDKLKSRTIMGMVNLSNFKYEGENVWEDGKIYDPENGKLYSCKMTLNNANQLNVRGYMGISLIGRTDVWTRVK